MPIFLCVISFILQLPQNYKDEGEVPLYERVLLIKLTRETQTGHLGYGIHPSTLAPSSAVTAKGREGRYRRWRVQVVDQSTAHLEEKGTCIPAEEKPEGENGADPPKVDSRPDMARRLVPVPPAEPPLVDDYRQEEGQDRGRTPAYRGIYQAVHLSQFYCCHPRSKRAGEGGVIGQNIPPSPREWCLSGSTIT